MVNGLNTRPTIRPTSYLEKWSQEDIAAAIQPRINLLSEAGLVFTLTICHKLQPKCLKIDSRTSSSKLTICNLASWFTWNNDTVSQTLMDLANLLNYVTLCQRSLLQLLVQNTSYAINGYDWSWFNLCSHALEIVGAPSKKEVKIWAMKA